MTFLPEKNYAMPERVGVETGMQTETFIIFSSNETAIVGKKTQLKVCILNSINSLNVTLKNVLKEKVLPSMALSENVNHLVHTVENDLSPKFFTFPQLGGGGGAADPPAPRLVRLCC